MSSVKKQLNFIPVTGGKEGGQYLSTTVQPTRENQGWLCVLSPTTVIPAAYTSNPLLTGKVTGVAMGWQKWIVEEDGKYRVTILGASGGNSGAITINPVTGGVTGQGYAPGRGAKIVGTVQLYKGDILYMLVGHRGWPRIVSGTVGAGACGGGASVILRVNKSGAFTFQPTNQKVECLFVAGGGGGAGGSTSTTANAKGKDAVLSNGTNTLGGTGGPSPETNGGGGAGLTGDGAGSVYVSGGMKSLLSGNSSSTSSSNEVNVAYGSWGGGGVSTNKAIGGGAGGGGYSGGNGGTSGIGGNGGTSYVNPSLVSDVLRAYPSVEADSQFGVTNPWASYGYIRLELLGSRDAGKFILALDADGYKYFDGVEDIDGNGIEGATDTWKLLPSQTLPEIDTYAEYGNRVITSTYGLQDQVKFLISSPNAEEKLEIKGNVNAAWLKQLTPVSVADVSLFKSITFAGNLNNVDVRFAISKNNGKTYQTYNAGSWVDIDITDKENFMLNAYPMSQFSTIPIEHWNEYKPATVQFIFCITQNGVNTNTIVQNLVAVCDLVGSWRHYKESEAEYEYISDTEMRVTFKSAGNYKVNYLDSLITDTSD